MTNLVISDIEKIRDVIKTSHEIICDGLCPHCDFLENDETCKLESAYDTIDELLENVKKKMEEENVQSF